MKRIIKDMVIASLFSGAIISGFNSTLTTLEAYDTSSRLHELNTEEAKLISSPETPYILERLDEIQKEKKELASKNISAKFGKNVLATTLFGCAGTADYLKTCYDDQYKDENTNENTDENTVN